MQSLPKTSAQIRKLPPVQRRMAELLVKDATPSPRVPKILSQWLQWLAYSVGVVAVTLVLVPPQASLAARLGSPAGLFLLLVFAGSALTAWAGIASSLPGEEPGPKTRALGVAFIGFLFGMPFLFFPAGNFFEVLHHNFASGWFCFRTVVLVAVPVWLFAGWRASRNASFQPGWTGAWLGASAFLLGTGTIQMHCNHWESCHMVVDHLLPLALFLFLPVWIGTYWFSRWREK